MTFSFDHILSLKEFNSLRATTLKYIEAESLALQTTPKGQETRVFHGVQPYLTSAATVIARQIFTDQHITVCNTSLDIDKSIGPCLKFFLPDCEIICTSSATRAQKQPKPKCYYWGELTLSEELKEALEDDGKDIIVYLDDPNDLGIRSMGTYSLKTKEISLTCLSCLVNGALNALQDINPKLSEIKIEALGSANFQLEVLSDLNKPQFRLSKLTSESTEPQSSLDASKKSPSHSKQPLKSILKENSWLSVTQETAEETFSTSRDPLSDEEVKQKSKDIKIKEENKLKSEADKANFFINIYLGHLTSPQSKR